MPLNSYGIAMMELVHNSGQSTNISIFFNAILPLFSSCWFSNSASADCHDHRHFPNRNYWSSTWWSISLRVLWVMNGKSFSGMRSYPDWWSATNRYWRVTIKVIPRSMPSLICLDGLAQSPGGRRSSPCYYSSPCVWTWFCVGSELKPSALAIRSSSYRWKWAILKQTCFSESCSGSGFRLQRWSICWTVYPSSSLPFLIWSSKCIANGITNKPWSVMGMGFSFCWTYPSPVGSFFCFGKCWW